MKIKKRKSSHKIVGAILNNQLLFLRVIREESHIPDGNDGDLVEESQWLVCETPHNLNVWVPYSTCLFVET